MRPLKATWKLYENEQTIPDDLRRELLLALLKEGYASWDIFPTDEELSEHVEKLMAPSR
jgi:hypothetical protein